jgi:hypothetical protein
MNIIQHHNQTVGELDLFAPDAIGQVMNPCKNKAHRSGRVSGDSADDSLCTKPRIYSPSVDDVDRKGFVLSKLVPRIQNFTHRSHPTRNRQNP